MGSLRIAWFLGFGWLTILSFIACGIGINLLHGPVVWVLYTLFFILSLYMTVRFRIFSSQKWRRVHSLAMDRYASFAGKEYDRAQKEGREYDVSVPCHALSLCLFGSEAGAVEPLLTDDVRKKYYKDLAKEFPQIFMKNYASKGQKAVLAEIDRDIDASQLGPDILIAKEIEVRHSREEAAIYLRSLLLGEVR